MSLILDRACLNQRTGICSGYISQIRWELSGVAHPHLLVATWQPENWPVETENSLILGLVLTQNPASLFSSHTLSIFLRLCDCTILFLCLETN